VRILRRGGREGMQALMRPILSSRQDQIIEVVRFPFLGEGGSRLMEEDLHEFEVMGRESVQVMSWVGGSTTWITRMRLAIQMLCFRRGFE
jgi:hypothetical protein